MARINALWQALWSHETSKVQKTREIGTELLVSKKKLGKRFRKLVLQKLPCSEAWASYAMSVARHWKRIEKSEEYKANPTVETARKLATRFRRQAGEADGRVRSGRRGSGRQGTPAERPTPGTTRINPGATEIDWFCKTHGPIYAFLEGTTKRLNEYLAGEADWPDGKPLSLAATRQSAERCAALLAKVVARVDALLAQPEEDEPEQVGE